jgi:hypothetical protein
MILNLKKLAQRLYPLLGGLIFSFAFYVAYSQINSDWYMARDDGVITFSHAKNWVDYGFIGINPSGERVEGYSAPFQFFIFAIGYLISKVSYITFVAWQTYIATFLLGATFISYFLGNTRFALISTAIAAIALTLSTSFIEWHGSGMENAMTHVLFAFSVYGLYSFSTSKKINFYWLPIFVFASISRLDGIYHIFPLLFLFALYWSIFEKNSKAWYLLVGFSTFWGLFQAWRYYYFGSLSSNTLLAQNIDLFGRLQAVLTLQRWYFIESYQLSKVIFLNHSGVLLLLTLPLAILARWTRSTALLFILALLLVFTACFNPFLFGETRLDPTRSTTQMAFFVLVATCVVAQGLPRKSLKIALLVAILPVLLVLRTPSYYLCCGVSSFEPIQNEFLAIAEQENLSRPTVANPDLGLMSWSKKLNILDIGMLGSPIFAKLRQGPLLANYFFDYAAPDLIESHETWSCQYWDTLFSDPRFKTLYRPIREASVLYGSCGETRLPKGIWIRRDIERNSHSAERRLMNDLDVQPSLERLKAELYKCQQQNTKLPACAYVARSAYRVLPELRKLGFEGDLLNVFKNSRTKEFDQYLISGYGDAQAYKNTLAWLGTTFMQSHHDHFVQAEHGFEVGVDNHFLVIMNRRCLPSDLKDPFYLEYRATGFDARHIKSTRKSFKFLQSGIQEGENCIASFPLSETQAREAVWVGQWIPKSNSTIWEVRVPTK